MTTHGNFNVHWRRARAAGPVSSCGSTVTVIPGPSLAPAREPWLNCKFKLEVPKHHAMKIDQTNLTRVKTGFK